MADETVRQMLLALLPRMRRFGVALTGSRWDAEDLVQTTCERVLLHSGQLDGYARLDAWLYSIMRNLWVSELRKRRIRRHEDVDAADGVVGEDGHAVVEGRMTLAAVRRAMDDLPEEQRVVLMLVCVDGLSYKDAAQVMEIPIGTVMSRLSRARQELHRRLEGGTAGKVTPLFPDRPSSDPDRARSAKGN